MKIHPYAKRFPDLSSDALRWLEEDIKRHGQIEPCLTFKGMVIDGRHRIKVCEKLGIKPKLQAWKGEESGLWEFLIARNMTRRFPEASARAVWAVQTLLSEERKKVATALRIAQSKRKAFVARQTANSSTVPRTAVDAAADDPNSAAAIVARKVLVSPSLVYKAQRICEMAKQDKLLRHLPTEILAGRMKISVAEAKIRAAKQGEAVVKQMVKQKDAAGHKADSDFAEVLYNECQDDKEWRFVCDRVDKAAFLRLATRLRWRLVGVK